MTFSLYLMKLVPWDIREGKIQFVCTLRHVKTLGLVCGRPSPHHPPTIPWRNSHESKPPGVGSASHDHLGSWMQVVIGNLWRHRTVFAPGIWAVNRASYWEQKFPEVPRNLQVLSDRWVLWELESLSG